MSSVQAIFKGILLLGTLFHCLGCADESSPQVITINEQLLPTNEINHVDISIAEYCSYTPNDKLTDYGNESMLAGVPPQKDIKKLDNLIKSNKLILVPDNSWSYVVRKSPNSYRYLTPNAYKILDSICNEFMQRKSNTALWYLRPTVTSMLRTIEAIGRIKNKSKSENSSHLHGTTFDISYVTFCDELGREALLSENELNYLKELLACVVESFRNNGKCYKTFEQGQQSHCIHIVCR